MASDINSTNSIRGLKMFADTSMRYMDDMDCYTLYIERICGSASVGFHFILRRKYVRDDFVTLIDGIEDERDFKKEEKSIAYFNKIKQRLMKMGYTPEVD